MCGLWQIQIPRLSTGLNQHRSDAAQVKRLCTVHLPLFGESRPFPVETWSIGVGNLLYSKSKLNVHLKQTLQEDPGAYTIIYWTLKPSQLDA